VFSGEKMVGDAGAIVHVSKDVAKMVYHPKGEVAAQLMSFAKGWEQRGVRLPRLESKPEAVCPVGDAGADARGSQESALIYSDSHDDVIASSVSCPGVSSLLNKDDVVAEVSNLCGTKVVENSVSYE
jgi:hypothetical protein